MKNEELNVDDKNKKKKLSLLKKKRKRDENELNKNADEVLEIAENSLRNDTAQKHNNKNEKKNCDKVISLFILLFIFYGKSFCFILINKSFILICVK